MRIRKRYKHFKRYRQVANILARHGFRYLIDQLGISEILSYRHRLKNEEEKIEHLSRATRLRLALSEMGPTFVKLGQILSTRADLVPKDVILELEKLQDEVPPFSFEEVKKQVETELEGELDSIFSWFSETPLAAASIGQVHRAKLKNGKEVVVKVRRPHIVGIIETDLEIIFDLARLAEKHTAWGARYSLVEVVEEFSYYIKRELDYLVEARNAERFAKNFADEPTVHIPKIYWDFSTTKVLTMEYVEGIKLSRKEKLRKKGYDLKKIAHNITYAVLKQIFFDGYFHADPHPGNIAVLEEEKVVFMDFGQVGLLSRERQKQFMRLLLGMVRGNSKTVVNTILDMGMVKKSVDLKSLRRDVDLMRDRYYSVPLSQLNLEQVLTEILNLAFKYNIRIPTELTMLSKALITLEGVVQELDKDFSVAEVAEPFAKKLFKQQYSPENLARAVGENTLDYIETLLEIPEQVDELLGKAIEGEVKIKMEHQNVNNLVSILDRITNRLSFSIVLLSFSIVMAGLVIGSALSAEGQTRFFLQLPILEVAFVIAAFMFIWLLYSIFRSGRL
ncbi:MAG: ubiquinone biosynthesis protein [Clostridia bacterium]|jgi:ubiquinone biosynthesis protein|nr:hypothetical protein [Clostridiales bacterium]MDK2985577.1 ubiquinone biosynthesis protein [Clostridia bacterium]